MRFAATFAFVALLIASTTDAQVVTGSGRSGGGSSPGGPVGRGPIIQPPLPEGTGAISGVVLDALTGQPLEGAVVSIGVTGSAPVARVARELTDGNGRFVFARLPERTDYLITASKIGYFDASYGQQESEVSSGSRIQLASGQWFSNARIALKKMGAISGTVSDENNEPVVGVYVRVLAVTSIAGTRQLATGPLTLTDDRGAYRIAGLPPGQYVVSVPAVAASIPADSGVMSVPTAPFAMFDPDASARLVFNRYPIPPPAKSGRRYAYPIVFSPGAVSANGATPVALGAGEERNDVNVRIQPLPAVRVSGVVQGPPDAYKGLTLRLLAIDFESLGAGSETATALVGANGAFTFLDVPPGSYVLDGSRRTDEYVVLGDSSAFVSRLPMPPGTGGWGTNSGNLESAPPNIGYISVSTGNGTDAYSAHATLNVGTTDLSGVVVTLQRTISISGYAVWEDGPPPNVFFTSADPSTGKLAFGRPSTITNRQTSQTPDEFLIEGLRATTYFLRPRADQYVVRSIVSNGRDYTNQPFDLSDGRDISDVVVTFTKQIGKVQGVVRSPDATASPDATVLIFPADESAWSNFGLSPTRLKSARVSSTGAFTITGLPAGDYLVVAVPAAQGQSWQDPDFLRRAARTASRVTLAWGQTASVDLNVGRIR